MNDVHNLNRFLEAQERDYSSALAEIKSGKKTSHWMWYVFPQLQGLGYSTTSKFYAIQDLDEAQAYLDHPLLGARLKEITTILLHLESKNAHTIFGSPDEFKLQSCMTLFSQVDKSDASVFDEVLKQYFGGHHCSKTLKLAAQ